MGNRFVKKRRFLTGAFGAIASILLAVAIIFIFNFTIRGFSEVNNEQALESAKLAITRAAVQFYAIEGRYPPSFEYLRDRFGLMIDEERFVIHYRAFSSNIMPQVIVMRRNL